MMILAEYRRHTQSLAEFLPWAALVEKCVILNKDGSFQRTARFRGPDLDLAIQAELVAITSRLDNALRRIGSAGRLRPLRAQPLLRTRSFRTSKSGRHN